jgi:hypothetical protein
MRAIADLAFSVDAGATVAVDAGVYPTVLVGHENMTEGAKRLAGTSTQERD